LSMLAQMNSAAQTRKPSLVDDAYRALKEAVRENMLPPGYQGSEQEIALRLGMSRTPVHEAIIRLQEDGLVRVLPKRGVTVCSISPDDTREIYDVIIALESVAAERIASLPSEARAKVAETLSQLNREMDKALKQDDLVAWARGDELFHRFLVEQCNNRRISRIAQTVADQAHRSRMFTLRLRSKPVASILEHRAIIKAIKRGDALVAHSRAREHRIRARDVLLPLLDQFGLKHL
jgi:DNA-binding GntR family transcriptional regulator